VSYFHLRHSNVISNQQNSHFRVPFGSMVIILIGSKDDKDNVTCKCGFQMKFTRIEKCLSHIYNVHEEEANQLHADLQAKNNKKLEDML
jgi:hypothetical protein